MGWKGKAGDFVKKPPVQCQSGAAKESPLCKETLRRFLLRAEMRQIAGEGARGQPIPHHQTPKLHSSRAVVTQQGREGEQSAGSLGTRQPTALLGFGSRLAGLPLRPGHKALHCAS